MVLSYKSGECSLFWIVSVIRVQFKTKREVSVISANLKEG